MALKTKGVPEGFSAQILETNITQFVWQNYTNGKIGKDAIKQFLEAWDFDTLSENLTRDFIRCYVHVAIKKVSDSTYLYIVDTNNDLDFSDEIVKEASVKTSNQLEQLYNENAVTFTYEALAEGNIETRHGEILILESSGEFKKHMPLMYSFPHHCISYLSLDGEKHKLNFRFAGGSRLQSENSIEVVHPITKSNIPKGESIIVSNHGFRVIGVNPSKKVLLLEKYRLDPNVPLAQKGFYAPEIAGVEFSSGDSLKLSDLRGKHVLLYVWATWCQPCYGSLPKLAALNDSISKDELQIFSAHFRSNPEALPSIIEEQNIHWPQLLNTQCTTDLQVDYTKRGVPFSCLIDPDGKIVEINVHGGDDLVGRIRALMSD